MIWKGPGIISSILTWETIDGNPMMGSAWKKSAVLGPKIWESETTKACLTDKSRTDGIVVGLDYFWQAIISLPKRKLMYIIPRGMAISCHLWLGIVKQSVIINQPRDHYSGCCFLLFAEACLGARTGRSTTTNHNNKNYHDEQLIA